MHKEPLFVPQQANTFDVSQLHPSSNASHDEPPLIDSTSTSTTRNKDNGDDQIIWASASELKPNGGTNARRPDSPKFSAVELRPSESVIETGPSHKTQISVNRDSTGSATEQESLKFAQDNGWTILNGRTTLNGRPMPEDGLIRFLREFEQINERRQNITLKRKQTKEQRRRVRAYIQQLFEVLDQIFTIIQRLALKTPITERELLQKVFNDFTQSELRHEELEEDLISAEFELEESEELLYRHILGKNGSDGNEDEALTAPDEIGLKDVSSRGTDIPKPSTARQQLEILQQQNLDVKAKLEDLDAEFEALNEEADQWALLNITPDEYAQHLVDSYPRRRGQLWKEMAEIGKKVATLKEITSDLSDAFFHVDQFDDADVDVQEKQEDPVALLNADQDLIAERQKDLKPLLDGDTPEESEDWIPVLPKQLDPENDLTGFVSIWLLKNLRTSFRSFMQFIFQGKFERTGLDYARLRSLLVEKWFDNATTDQFNETLQQFVVSLVSAPSTATTGAYTSHTQFLPYEDLPRPQIIADTQRRSLPDLAPRITNACHDDARARSE